MEQSEDSDCDVLKKILTEDELTQVSDTIANKLRKYFNEHFEEYITAKAVFQHSKQSLGNLFYFYSFYFIFYYLFQIILHIIIEIVY